MAERINQHKNPLVMDKKEEKKKRCQSTIDKYIYYWENYIKGYSIAARPLRELTVGDYQDWAEEIVHTFHEAPVLPECTLFHEPYDQVRPQQADHYGKPSGLHR